MAKILAVTSRLPYPPNEGHQLRAWHLLKAMASEHEVTLLSFQRSDDDLRGLEVMRNTFAAVETFEIPSEKSKVKLTSALLRSLSSYSPFVVEKYRNDKLAQRFNQLAAQADLVHLDMLPLIAYADQVPKGIPVTYNAHNVEHVLLDKRIEVETRKPIKLFLRTQKSRLEVFEKKACLRANLTIACSAIDADGLRALAPSMPAPVVIPNGVDLDNNTPDFNIALKPQLVFVGQMGWFPNRDGVDWFLREVFPAILQRKPELEFVLVGKSQGFTVPQNVADRVRITGFVDDLRPIVRESAIYIVPLRAGSGTRLKVVEAMALGKAIVTTSIGSEGIALEDGKDAVFADSPQAFANAVCELIDQPEKIRGLGQSARQFAERAFGWQAIGQEMLDHYRKLL